MTLFPNDLFESINPPPPPYTENKQIHTKLVFDMTPQVRNASFYLLHRVTSLADMERISVLVGYMQDGF